MVGVSCLSSFFLLVLPLPHGFLAVQADLQRQLTRRISLPRSPIIPFPKVTMKNKRLEQSDIDAQDEEEEPAKR